MPCYDPQDSTRETVYLEGHDPHYQAEAKRLSVRCEMLTNLLCLAGRAWKNKTDIPPDVLNYWEQHCKEDHKQGRPW